MLQALPELWRAQLEVVGKIAPSISEFKSSVRGGTIEVSLIVTEEFRNTGSRPGYIDRADVRPTGIHVDSEGWRAIVLDQIPIASGEERAVRTRVFGRMRRNRTPVEQTVTVGLAFTDDRGTPIHTEDGSEIVSLALSTSVATQDRPPIEFSMVVPCGTSPTEARLRPYGANNALCGERMVMAAALSEIMSTGGMFAEDRPVKVETGPTLWKKADAYFSNILKVHRLEGEERAKASSAAGTANLFLEQYDRATRFFVDASEAVKNDKDDAHKRWTMAAGLSSLLGGCYESAVKYYNAALRSDTKAEAYVQIRTRLGYCYLLLGRRKKALEELQLAFDRAQAVKKTGNECMAGAPSTALGVMLGEMGRHHEAREHFLSALQCGDGTRPTKTRREVLSNLGTVNALLGELQVSRQNHKKAIELSRQIAGERSAEMVKALSRFGQSMGYAGQEEAFDIFKWAERAAAGAPDISASEVATVDVHLGIALMRRGRVDEAIQRFRSAKVGTEHVNSALREHAEAARRLALAVSQADPIEAATLWSDALDSATSAHGARSRQVADVHVQIGLHHHRQEEHQLAEGSLKRGLSIYRRLFGPIDSRVLDIQSFLGTVLFAQEKFQQAASHYRAEVLGRIERGEEGELRTCSAMRRLGAALSRAGSYDEALERLEVALACAQTHQADLTRTIHNDLLYVHHALGNSTGPGAHRRHVQGRVSDAVENRQ